MTDYNIQLDISKLSPNHKRVVRKTLFDLQWELTHESRRMEDELVYYPESDAKEEMENWKNALDELTQYLRQKCHELFYKET